MYFFLCYLIKAAASVCLLGLELGKPQSETQPVASCDKILCKRLCFLLFPGFPPFLQLFPLLAEN